MNSIESEAVIRYMEKIFQNWEPSDEAVEMWKNEFKFHDEQVALRAVREASLDTNYHKPPAKDIRKLLRQYRPTVTKLRVEPDDPTVFLMYEGDGNGRLQPGYFMPIITKPGVDELQAAERSKTTMLETYGGFWKVYQETDYHAMIKLRSEMRAAIVDKISETI